MVNDADIEQFKSLALFCRANRITRAKLNNMELEIELPILPDLGKGEGEILSDNQSEPTYNGDIFEFEGYNS